MRFVLQLTLAALIVLPPLALGARRHRIEVVRSWLWGVLAAAFLLGALQLVPLPRSVLELVLPAGHDVWTRVLDDPDSPRPISLHPAATRRALLRLGVLVLTLFVVVNGVRQRASVQTLLLCIAAVATFEAAYGLLEQVTGRQRIFWLQREHHLTAVTGTYHNKNHFAGLLEMALPVTLMLTFAPARRGVRATEPSLAATSLCSGARCNGRRRRCWAERAVGARHGRAAGGGGGAGRGDARDLVAGRRRRRLRRARSGPGRLQVAPRSHRAQP